MRWEGASKPVEVSIAIEARDRPGLLRDITERLADARVNVLQVNTLSHRDEATATMHLKVEVTDLAALDEALNRIEALENIMSAHRYGSA